MCRQHYNNTNNNNNTKNTRARRPQQNKFTKGVPNSHVTALGGGFHPTRP